MKDSYTPINSTSYPKHIAIMLDGNRRWAKKQGLPAFAGHKKSSENLDKILDAAKDFGVECVTLWAFSTENWKRSEEEVSYLFNIFRSSFKTTKTKFLKEKIRFMHIGRRDRIAPDVRQSIEELEELTKDFTKYTVVAALDYGGQDELIRTINKLIKNKQEITIENIEQNLDTASLPPVDLIIRTGGEQRLSGFLLWQCAYSELYFTDTPFPDFSPEELKKALDGYSCRDRRFGGDSKKK